MYRWVQCVPQNLVWKSWHWRYSWGDNWVHLYFLISIVATLCNQTFISLDFQNSSTAKQDSLNSENPLFLITFQVGFRLKLAVLVTERNTTYPYFIFFMLATWISSVFLLLNMFRPAGFTAFSTTFSRKAFTIMLYAYMSLISGQLIDELLRYNGHNYETLQVLQREQWLFTRLWNHRTPVQYGYLLEHPKRLHSTMVNSGENAPHHGHAPTLSSLRFDEPPRAKRHLHSIRCLPEINNVEQFHHDS